MEAQRVMVIQDGSKEVCSSAIRWAIQGLFLKAGDLLVLLGVLHEVNYPTTLSFKGTRKNFGYRKKVDSSSEFGSNHRILGREAARKNEYENNAEIMEISKLYKAEKVEFRIEVAAGASPAVVALKSAENFATWVILDRKMKKNKKIFLEKLSCGISRMKRNNSIELLRGPKMKFNELSVTYEDMMPGALEEEDLFSIELFPTCQSEANHSVDSVKEFQAEETFGGRPCTICDKRKQNIVWRKDFTYSELQAATDGFSSKNNLSDGAARSTFRGQLENKLNIVIKPAKNNIYFQEPNKFKSEIDKLSRIRHKNLVMLLGCCAEGSHRLLVYQYLCNRSLDQHLSKCHPWPLTWTERLRIAMGASKGLNHLHENNIIHGDIRPSKILLNHDFEPLLGDLGLPTTRSEQENIQNIQTSGCLAPEYLENGIVSTQTDVYSFGVVLLELITGQRTTDERLGHTGYLTWARTLLKQRRYQQLLDPRIANSHDVYQELNRIAQLAQKCLRKNPRKRLTMNKVVSTLEFIIESKPSNSHEDLRLLKSFLPHNWVKTVHHESSVVNGADVTSYTRSRSFSFSANVRRWQSLGGFSSNDGEGYKFFRAKSASASQVLYGEMLS